ncbi:MULTISPECIES: PLD nuclease N-terminal domain-containing protein [Bacillales]|uniref:PLD nuclease N-terminal domain-containing protein n=1 Tax=Bacillales TaxID=1385 RepID=UPI0006A7BA77|nr:MULTISPECIES: PLD nuclease N-terminal domain-containing protein [Bacillales]OBZ08526.1 transcriptional regulator [Bacillus sp. FJAT-26390]
MKYDQIELSQILPIVAPIIVIQLILMVIALILCMKAESTRGPKWMWALIIIFGNIIGPIAFFIAGRRNER